ncbi:Alpha/Beta hydrolase protein [Roridomyces roridus]|uniref:Alpha/Beta hydrolase protein n=1 Tax=Roridomyces roridus TaxID=1738132 RepID=A0AAD7BYQ9_9AGAR|nr:Alpha/Beta hydrolase protein [Roridomyces roridus]
MPYAVHPDGAQISYRVLGDEHIGRTTPFVCVGGVGSLQGDWERLATSLSRVRPVLVYDHRGMGESKLATRDDEISIEGLARDLLFVLERLGWKEIAICGFSMGGIVTQQLLFLPYHPVRPTPLPFRVTHVVLAGTLCSPLRDKRYGLPITPLPDLGRPLTEQEKLDIARPNLELSLDKKWLADPRNAEDFDRLLRSRISGRSALTGRIEFTGMHAKLPRSTQFLEILQRIPWAKSVQVGSHPGAVENLEFGHMWFEYFGIQVWHDVVEKFLTSPTPARL